MKCWQTIFHFAFQSSDVEGSDGCGGDSDWVNAWLHLVPIQLTALCLQKSGLPNLSIQWSRGLRTCRTRSWCPGENEQGKKKSTKKQNSRKKMRGCATDWSTWLGYLKIAWWESSFLRDSCDTRCLNCYLNHVFITRLPGNSILNLCNLYVKMRQSILIHFFGIIFMKLWLHELFFPFSSPLISLVSTHPVKLLFFVTHGFLVK